MSSIEGAPAFRPLREAADAVSASSPAIAVDTSSDAAAPDAPEAAAGSGSRITYEAGGEVTVLRSLCMCCEEQGQTRLLLTRIPFFRDVILMAFECAACGYRSSEVQAAEVQSRGCRFSVVIASREDLDRQLVKGDKASVTVPEIDFEIPAGTQGGVFTTVEGLLDRALENLSGSQPLRLAQDPEGADAVEAFLVRLRALREGRAFPFTLVLDDPTGNSFVENRLAPRHDPAMRVRFYVRSAAVNASLGLAAGNARAEGGSGDAAAADGTIAEVADEEAEYGAEAQGVGVAAALNGAGSSSSSTAVMLPVAQGGYGQVQDEDEVASSGAFSSDAAAAGGDGEGDRDGDHGVMLGSGATTNAAFRDPAAAPVVGASSGSAAKAVDLSGNVPGGFKKGGALITRLTARAALTDDVRGRAEVLRGGSAFPALRFDSSAAGAETELMLFPQDCFNCSAKGEVRMCSTDVPHFKEVILMSFACDECGWKNVEVKGGGAVPPQGTVNELRFRPGLPHSADDLRRDVIKGDTAAVELVELELSLEQGSLGGLYTTVEGLLTIVRDKLKESDPFAHAEAGDSSAGGGHAGAGSLGEEIGSASGGRAARMLAVFKALEAYARGERAFTLRLQDPMANTWIYSPFADGLLAEGPDPSLSVTTYARSAEEDGDLGLLDMDAPEDMSAAVK